MEVQRVTKFGVWTAHIVDIFYLTENCGHHNDTVTNSHKQELVFLCTEVYRTPSHEYIKMTVTKTNITISPMQPNDVSMGCKVFKVPF